MENARLRFAIDRGGTFTDVYSELLTPMPDGTTKVQPKVVKLLSEDPANYEDAPREGIRRIVEWAFEKAIPRDQLVPTGGVERIRMGTTVATNALLERKGERTVLAITEGFKDLLHIGNQSRPKIFDLRIHSLDQVYEEVVEVEECVMLAEGPLGPHQDSPGEIVQGLTGEKLKVLKPPNLVKLREQLSAIRAKGVTSIAVVLKHSYTFARHEQAVAALAKELGFDQISTSSDIMPMVKMVPRGYTACADAYLTPKITKYLETFTSGFDSGVRTNCQLAFQQSDGGLAPVDQFSGSKAILSGPAAGVVGIATTAYGRPKRPEQPVIGFDMGGTSTDVSRYAGRYEHVMECTIAGVTIQAPQLDINTVAAGGGSRLFFRAGLFAVGPESAGAHPGPVCYRKDGHLAVTDANLVLGRVQPAFFPHIFGKTEDMPLDLQASRTAFGTLVEEINSYNAASTGAAAVSIEQAALGFIRVANEAMCRPIRALTQMRGYDISKHSLAVFGGAGGQHCCAMAKSLGMSHIFVHKYASILSAVGLSRSNLVKEGQEPCASTYAVAVEGLAEDLRKVDTAVAQRLLGRLSSLAETATLSLLKEGMTRDDIVVEKYLNLRYQGTDSALMTLGTADGDFLAPFVEQYEREFGFTLPDRSILVDDIRVRVIGQTPASVLAPVSRAEDPRALPEPKMIATCFFEEGSLPTPWLSLSELKAGNLVDGPAVIMDQITTLLVEPGWTAEINENGDIEIERSAGGVAVAIPALDPNNVDPIQLSIFSHRFMSIAEQMGRALQRTSISVNIKERLDFSCALFGPDGKLVANAPHIPVHLGAMQEAVKFQLSHWGDNLQEGDVLVSNHPQLAGGSHLPDITVITPVFHKGKVVFVAASRGHHADIGGTTPGSMPPLSKSIHEEGAQIVAFKLVRDGEFQEEGITELLMKPGTLGIEGCVGTRNLKDNMSDLRAQVAANTQGISLVHALIAEYSLEVVQAYMAFIRTAAANAVRDMLVSFSKQEGLAEVGSVTAVDYMDDGSPICLKVTIDRSTKSAVFDFEGTGPEVLGNLNAPPAVVYSAIIYCMRCMVDTDIPLNQGCLEPCEVLIPKGCLLNPSPTAAVVGGNVTTSQRLVDVVLKAFGACAASQGCCNNLTFGDGEFGYYETIAGGAGAGPGWHGRSGVQTHMTNTRITDPEILERRYPVLLKEFGLRQGSGGAGCFKGGNGVVRTMEMLKPLKVSILSERRSNQPYGLLGGECGARGLNHVLVGGADGRLVSMGGKNTMDLAAGDHLRIKTPGGGGYGAVGASESSVREAKTLGKDVPLTPAACVGSVARYTVDQESA